MAKLRRDRDGEGHYGSRVESFDPETGKWMIGGPHVGMALKVGTLTAGTYSRRDWWMTTPVTEIISEDDKTVKFKTRNSTYTMEK